METASSFIPGTEAYKRRQYRNLISQFSNQLGIITHLATMIPGPKSFLLVNSELPCSYFPKDLTDKLAKDFNVKFTCEDISDNDSNVRMHFHN